MANNSLPLPGEIVIHDYRPQEKPIVNESLKVLQWNIERNYGIVFIVIVHFDISKISFSIKQKNPRLLSKVFKIWILM